ncbi:MAG: thioredoxin family protein [Flavobacteriales bacterium]|nr:thioredoxin family protein [Flavobacteriales bacterium]MCB9198115.1 thioredoxin family protein [Flavobacteriales bacterium]
MKQFLSLIGLFLIGMSFGQDLHWTSIHDIEDSMAKQPKPILVKIETPWCGYCKMMDQKVYPWKKITKELNANFYYVKLNAEENQTITLNDTTYNYKMNFGKRGIQDLAVKWGKKDGMIKYPTTVILDQNYQVIKFLDGYLPKQNFYYWLTED